MSHLNPKLNPRRDILQTELQTAQVVEIKDAVTWRITDIINSSSNIQLMTSRARVTYIDRVKLQRAAADLRDVSSKLQESEQYLSQ